MFERKKEWVIQFAALGIILAYSAVAGPLLNAESAGARFFFWLVGLSFCYFLALWPSRAWKAAESKEVTVLNSQ